MKNKKAAKRKIRHKKIRNKLISNSTRPRLCVFRSLKNMSVQLVDDSKGVVVVGMSTLDKSIKNKFKQCGNIQAAQVLGECFAKKAKEKGITKVSFDRAGHLYHGRVKAFAESARNNGLEF